MHICNMSVVLGFSNYDNLWVTNLKQGDFQLTTVFCVHFPSLPTTSIGSTYHERILVLDGLVAVNDVEERLVLVVGSHPGGHRHTTTKNKQ